MNGWLRLSGCLYFFGSGGINRIEPLIDWIDGVQTEVGSQLYVDTKWITNVSEKINDIAEKWYGTNGL